VSYPQQRDLRAELEVGATELSYKRVVRDRGGFVEPTTSQLRTGLLADTWYGIHEAPVKIDPFGRPVVIPDTHTGGPVTYPGS
jgi:hypothetical protein